MMVVIYQKSISTLLGNDVIPRVYKKSRWDFRSPLMKKLDWSFETLGRECSLTELCIHLYKTRVARENEVFAQKSTALVLNIYLNY